MKSSAAYWTFSDSYLMTLGALLAGYAIIGRPFAYIGVPPVYVGEVVFVMGTIAFLKSKCAVASLVTLPSLLLGILIGWVAIRTLANLSEFGADALRDSAIIGYGGFAFTTAALLLEKPGRLSLIISYLRVVGSTIILVAPLLIIGSCLIPNMNLYFNLSLLANHLAGAALLILLDFKRAGIGWLILLCIGIAMLSTETRNGMCTIVISLTFALIVTGRWRTLGAIVIIMASIIALAYMLDLSVTRQFGDLRNISARQLLENFFSIFGGTTEGNQWGTRQWRIEWWNTIFDYTFNGPYFWTGKGFGINLATAAGFLGTPDQSAPLLRSPHNGHLTILARLGVPGLALWLLTLCSWCAMLLVNMVHARRCGDNAWADLFVLIFCYTLAFIVDMTFSVTLEGPQGGIWFWSLFGVGLGTTMIYRAYSGGSPAGKRLIRLGAPDCVKPSLRKTVSLPKTLFSRTAA